MSDQTLIANQLAELLKKQSEKAGLKPEQQAELLKFIYKDNKPKTPLDFLITSDDRTIRTKEKVLKLTPNNYLNVMIIGETGTGKELIARALHGNRQGEFVAVNCAGIPKELFEAEFFGAAKGSYTGCTTTRDGYFEQAKDGTIFLDEIAEIPYEIQGKLLRVIENRKIRKLGSAQEISINCRIISATNCLNLMKHTQHFRQDLFYRLRGSLIETTPLRERRNDIRLIATYFDKQSKIPVEIIESWVNDSDHFPFIGNVRELKNLVREYLCVEFGLEID